MPFSLTYPSILILTGAVLVLYLFGIPFTINFKKTFFFWIMLMIFIAQNNWYKQENTGYNTCSKTEKIWKQILPVVQAKILLRQLINLALMIPSLFQSYWNSNHPSNIFCKQFFPQPQLISRADPSIPQLMHSTLLRMELSKLLLVCVWIRFILLKILKNHFSVTVHF